ncbi:hypothetical protein HPO96_19380 [Kribbella sandramycini]|uniref:Uncharacterized protein n=1 Tax=Kribbella sandramycini TaxID=60450 RepID=A0A7Y4L146_9ACTN|nr:hypothetical protein [Kribbella sandramycini]MBB6564712.1 hypothetical protein [Kribbella sandramycini]NOL42414.1 hypothetical protein [Kribbella sandramycini]
MSTEEASARVVRALLDYRSIWTTHDLVEFSQVPTPAVRAILNTLEAETLIDRRRGGIVAVPDWPFLLSWWATTAPLAATNKTSYWQTTGTIRRLFGHIAATSTKHALSGVHAAGFSTASTPDLEPVIYTPDAQAAATAWALAPVETDEPASRRDRVVLIETTTDVVYLRRRGSSSGVRVAAPTQVLADLSQADATPEEEAAAKRLLAWMQAHELTWRY